VLLVLALATLIVGAWLESIAWPIGSIVLGALAVYRSWGDQGASVTDGT
jgi:hypothetical protein